MLDIDAYALPKTPTDTSPHSEIAVLCAGGEADKREILFRERRARPTER